MPSAVRFADAGDTRPFVSIDGGKQWGLLSDLSISMTDGTRRAAQPADVAHVRWAFRSEEHTSELQSLMRISYAVFCLKKKKSEQCYNDIHQLVTNKTSKQQTARTAKRH